MTGDAALLGPKDGEWGDALARIRHDVYHLPEYVRIDAELSSAVPSAYWYTEGPDSFLLPLTMRPIPDSGKFDVTSPYGYPAPISTTLDAGFWHRAVTAMTDLLRAEDVVTAFVRMHPLLPAVPEALKAAGVLVNHGQTVAMDLSLSDEQRWRETRRTHRKHINQALRAGVRVVMDDWSRLDTWVRTYHDNMRRVGASAYYFFPAEYFQSLHDGLDERMHLALAECDGEVLGGTVFFEHDGIVQAHLQSVRDGWTFHADKLLYDSVRRWAAARGNWWYHIGGGIGGDENSLFFYKAGFSPVRHEFHTWRVVIDGDAYAELLGPHIHAGDSMTGYFPPYR